MTPWQLHPPAGRILPGTQSTLSADRERSGRCMISSTENAVLSSSVSSFSSLSLITSIASLIGTNTIYDLIFAVLSFRGSLLQKMC